MHVELLISTQTQQELCQLWGINREQRIQYGHGFSRAAGSRENGAALITALMILLVMTLLGVTAVTTSSLQEKMAGNMRDQYMAQQAGDSILRDGESWVFKLLTRPTPACSPPSAERVWDYNNCSDVQNIANQTDSWWTGNGYVSNVANTFVSQEPRYVVEHLQAVVLDFSKTPKEYRHFYRVTGWSVGASEYARGLFQSVFSRRSDEFQSR